MYNVFLDYFPLYFIKNIEYSSLCYTVGPCLLFVLYKYTVSYLKHTYLEQKKNILSYISEQ